jgi:hypothetical protein
MSIEDNQTGKGKERKNKAGKEYRGKSDREKKIGNNKD